ncbi:MAG: alpha/beta hydrolase family protein [Sulfobacillus sp.]
MSRPALRSRPLGMVCMLLVFSSLAGCSAIGGPQWPGLTISSSLNTKADGSPASLTPVRGASFPSYVQPGEQMYSLSYWSQGQRVQGYLDVPPGNGPFPLLVDLHGGSVFSLPHHAADGMGFSQATAQTDAWPPAIVFMPNYAGYGPSSGTIGNVHSDYLDAINGLTALGHLRGLQIRPNAIYVAGGSMGGDVAMMVAEHDKQVRAVSLVSPYPGDIEMMKWLQAQPTLDSTDLQYLNYFKYYYGVNLNSMKYRENSFQYHLADIPIQIIAGNRDTILPPSLMQTMYQHLKQYDSNVELQFVPGGHAPSSYSIDLTISGFLYHWGL